MKPGKKRLKQQRRIKALRARDGDTCCYCGIVLKFHLAGSNFRDSPSIEHVHSRSDGGSDALVNLKLAHVLCNERVGDLSVTAKLALMARHGHTSRTPVIESGRVPAVRQNFDQVTPPNAYARVYLDKPNGWVKKG